MAQHVILVLLSNARELEGEERRAEIVEALRPLHTAPNALGSEAPTVVYTEQGNGNATVALAVDVQEGEDLQAPVDDVRRRIRQYTGGRVDAAEIVRIEGP